MASFPALKTGAVAQYPVGSVAAVFDAGVPVPGRERAEISGIRSAAAAVGDPAGSAGRIGAGRRWSIFSRAKAGARGRFPLPIRGMERCIRTAASASDDLALRISGGRAGGSDDKWW